MLEKRVFLIHILKGGFDPLYLIKYLIEIYQIKKAVLHTT